jgi:HEAT repeat protein
MRSMDPTSHLTKLFEAERAARSLHRDLLSVPAEQLLAVLKKVVREAGSVGDAAETALRLVRVAPLLQGTPGPEAVDLLIDMLGSDVPEGRLAAGEALEGVVYERFKEVALGVERALKRLPPTHAALMELPYLLAEVGEPSVTKLLGRFLQSESAEVVSSAIESLVELGDRSAIPMIEALTGDTRRVHLDDEDEEVSIGALAFEACEILNDSEEDDS